ncbi:LppM family (lipo)protein [Serinibacter salmoneus]|uniref:LppM domain-containing protein n=1 Tax=Serinibacter salmoneus TaxID=556530 RepID=A0A2A9D2T8_9MICO|nr:hypothetical protein [Serinibacter salmoneus]PFG20973.1 hypothetical protein ATL40_2592 [Serinibacter salmoneus]
MTTHPRTHPIHTTATATGHPTTPGRRLRSGGIAVALLATATLLTGCMRATYDLEVDGDLNVSGEMLVAIQASALERFGSSDQDIWQNTPEVIPPGATVEVYDEDGYAGFTVRLQDVPAAEFLDGGDLATDGETFFVLEREDDVISFDMEQPITHELESDASLPGLDSTSMIDEAWVEITFPGPVIEAEGAEIDGNTARWDLAEHLGPLAATAEVDAGFPWPMMLGVMGGLTGVGTAALLLARRGGTRAQTRAEQMPPAYLPGGHGRQRWEQHGVGSEPTSGRPHTSPPDTEH